jgi:diguanylate cyclase (GGDEF)-like protein/PAS domain S-box-containing protein
MLLRAATNLSALRECTEDRARSVDSKLDFIPLQRALRQDRGAPGCRESVSEGSSLAGGRALGLDFKPPSADKERTGESVFTMDITERNTAEAALRQGVKKDREVFASALEGVFQTALEGEFIPTSPGLTRMLGYDSSEEIVLGGPGWAHQVWVHSEDCAKLARLLKEQEEVRGFECQFRRKDGAPLWISFNSWKVRGADGRALYRQGFMEDISERKRTAQALGNDSSRFRLIFEENGSVMLVLDPGSGEIVEANAAAASFYGYPREQLTGMNICQINILPWQAVAVERQRALREQRSCFDFRHRLASGEEREVEVHSTPINVDGRMLLFSIIHDITQRKRAEELLLEKLETLKEAQAIGSVGGYVLDIPAGVWKSSEVLDEILGIGNGFERTVESWEALIHPDDRAMVAAYFATEVAGQGKAFDKEYRVVRQTDGAERWVHGLGRLEFDAQERPRKMRGTIRDITERKQTELELRDSEERYRATFEQAAVGIVHTAFDGRFLRCNERFAEMIGYSKEEVQALSFQQITLPEDRDTSDAVRQRMLDGETDAVSWEKRYVHKNGSPIWVKATVSVQRESAGRPLHFIALVEDIGLRKAAEERLTAAQQALRTSEAHYRTVFETSLDGICVTNLSDGRYIDANQAFLSILGFEREEVIGRTSMELNLWADPPLRRRLVEMLEQHSGFQNEETQYRTKTGKLLWVQISSSLIAIEGLSCILSVVRDISEAKAAEKRLKAALEALRGSEERYRAAFQMSLDCVILNRLDNGAYVEVNRAFVEIIGYSREELIGHSSLELNIWADPRDREKLAEELRRSSVYRNLEVRLRRKNGTLLWGLMSASVLDLDGVPCILSVTRDITEAKAAEQFLAQAQEALGTSEKRYRTIFQTNLDSVVITRISDGLCVDANRTFLELAGCTRDEVLGRTTADLKLWAEPGDRQRLLEALGQNGTCRDLEAKFKKKNGEIVTAMVSASLIEIDETPCILSVARDISGAKAAQDRIRDLAFYDPLTRLPNRRLLLDRLQQALAAAARSTSQHALLLVDLDYFKTLNDTLGHTMGDLLLQEAARRISGCVHATDSVARLGADEFAVLLEDLSEVPEEAATQAEYIAGRVLKSIGRPFFLEANECHSTASVGIAVFRDQTQNPEGVLRQAELAMYQAKEAGRNAMRFFAPALQAAVNARAAIEKSLRRALRDGEFLLYYQPQVDHGVLVGAEALIRWKHPKRGMLMPGEFIALAEETGLILPLGNWVLEAACTQIAAWARRQETALIVVAVNISARQFRQHDFVDQVLAALDRTGANPRSLRLELTESMLVDDIEDVIAKMTELKAHGLRFSLDDFGTGYSSLTYLRRLPLDELKIDRSFVKDILVEASNRSIVQAIISMSQAMGLSVVAEGVEDEQQRAMLAALGCHSFQGYLYSRPVPLEDFERLVPGIADDAAFGPGAS